jgi:hypothetical protein
MAESIFTVQTPANPDEDDGVQLTLGTRFVPTVNGTIDGIRWFFPASPTAGTINGRLYSWVSNTVGALLSNADFVAPTPGAWNTVNLPVPIAVTAGTPYVTAVYTPLGEYVSTAALFASAITNGNLTATADTPTEENGKFVGGNAYPDDSFNGNGYFVDVLFTASVAPTGTEVPVGLAHETDAAFGVAASTVAAVGLAHETDAALPVRAAVPIAVGQANEVDSASAIAGSMIATLGVANEVDSAEDLSGGEATDMPFVDAPCEPWPAMWNDCDLPAGSAAFTGTALAAASEVLWAMSGRRFSFCPVTLRPCRETCNDWYDTGSWWNWGGGYPRPRFYQGVWTNVMCGQCMDGCSCSFVSKVRLPMPVSSITNVTIYGVTLDPSAYQVYDYRDIVRQDGGQWPECNDLSRPLGQPDTWSITVEVGEPVPVMGRIAVAELATEFVKAFLCDASCQLPAPVQQLSRQGVSMSFLDPNEVFANGRLGLRFADMFLSTYNPDGLRAPSRVYSVDNPIGRIPT